MNMQLICLRGIPASWKSTYCEAQIKEKGAKVFSKDKLRKLAGITPSTWTKELEWNIIEQERKCVTKAIHEKKLLIIVDNTHLWFKNKHISFYRDLADKNWYEFSIKDFYVSRIEAIKRDKERGDDSVGESVINKMIKMQGNWGYPTNPTFRKTRGKPTAYICDIDGTLAFMNDRRTPYEYDKVGGDTVNPFLRGLLTKLAEDNTIFIVSGREDVCRPETKKWLEDNLIPHDHLLMREVLDKRKDSIVKKEIYDNYIQDNYDVLWVFDDRCKVVDMWRLELNLPTYQCWYGNF